MNFFMDHFKKSYDSIVPEFYLVYSSLLCSLYLDRLLWLAPQLGCKSTEEDFLLFGFSRKSQMHYWHFALSALVFIRVADYFVHIAARIKAEWTEACQEEARMRNKNDLSNISSVSHFSSVFHIHYSYQCSVRIFLKLHFQCHGVWLCEELYIYF